MGSFSHPTLYFKSYLHPYVSSIEKTSESIVKVNFFLSFGVSSGYTQGFHFPLPSEILLVVSVDHMGCQESNQISYMQGKFPNWYTIALY